MPAAETQYAQYMKAVYDYLFVFFFVVVVLFLFFG